MEIAEFIEETGRIENFFEKELTKFQRDEWYKQLKIMPINRYRQVVNQSFRECKFMPKLADIVSISEELPYQTTKKEIQKVECSKCKGEGLIFYKRLVDNGKNKIEYEYVARCECQNGLEYVYDGTTISDSKHRSKFYVPTAQQIGL